MSQLLLFFALTLMECVWGNKPCSKPDHDCDCSHFTWATCQNKRIFPFGSNLPNSTLFLSLASNKVGPILTSNEVDKLERLLLENLDLTKNQIQSVEDKAFSSLTKLTVLSLSYNKISGFSDETLSGLSSLLYLFANNMELLFLANNTFTPTLKLQYIDLENNNLTVIGKQFAALPDLSTLLLANNQLLLLYPYLIVCQPGDISFETISHASDSSSQTQLLRWTLQIRRICSNSFIYQLSLIHLSLFGNKLSSPIPEWFYNIVRNNGKIELDRKIGFSVRNSNRWTCCYNIFRYREFVRSLNKRSKVFQLLDIVCSCPADLMGRRISSLFDDKLNSSSCFLNSLKCLSETFYETPQTILNQDQQMKTISSNHNQELNKVLEKNYLLSLNSLQMIFFFLISLLVLCLLAGSINYIVMRLRRQEEFTESKTSICFKVKKPSTRPFRLDLPTYGVTDPISRNETSIPPEKGNFSSHQDVSQSATSTKTVEFANEFENSNYFFEPDQSEDEPWSVVDRDHDKVSKIRQSFR